MCNKQRICLRAAVFASIALTGSLYAQGLAAPFDVPRMTHVQVDGRPADWGEAGLRVDMLRTVRGNSKGVSDHDARVRLGWNDSGLLLLVDVQDDVWVEHAAKDKLWALDAIEVFLAPEHGASNMCQWVIAPGMAADQSELRWHLHDHRSDNELKSRPAALRAARSRSPDGCVVEVLLPWEALAIDPALGREIAFQIYIDDADATEDLQPYVVAWYPAAGTHMDTRRMCRLRLSEQAGRPVVANIQAEHDFRRMQTLVTVAARATLVGKTVRLLKNGQSIAQTTLKANAEGRASGAIPFAMSTLGEQTGALDVELDGEPVGQIDISGGSRRIAESLVWARPIGRPCVFAGSTLPKVEFEQPLRMRAMVGPYELKTTYYDRDYSVVTKALRPGRYGAVVEVQPERSRSFRRFVTLYRLPEDFRLRDLGLSASIAASEELGVAQEVAQAYEKTIDDFVKAQIADGTHRSDDLAVLLAGLSEAEASSADNDFFNNPSQRDRRWWVGLKRKIYGWDKEALKTFECPYPIVGEPSPVVRKGTLGEAGMKPDAADRIDTVLAEWAQDSDEAFAVCVVRHGVIVLHKAYGVRDAKAMTVDTPSWMASITKMISGACMMMLVDQGLIDLDDNVADHLPPLRGLKPNKPLTIRHLYTHTSGFRGHWGAELNDMEERVANLLPHLSVGTAYQYNGAAMDLTTKILEAVTGESLPDYYRKHLLNPLGCKHTTIPDAGGGTVSVPLDMARIAQMLLNRGSYGDVRFMSEKTFEKMLPQRLTKTLGPDAEFVYGIGTCDFDDEGLGANTFGHGAASAATMRIDPDNDLIVIMTRNRAGRNFKKYHQRFIDAVVAGIADDTD